MLQVLLTPDAEESRIEIWRYVAQDSPECGAGQSRYR
jgi:plasmid stabilization system protein ParE